MGMYNMIFGSRNELGDALAKVLGFTGAQDLGRFRDCWVEEVDGEPVIAFHTRNGGGNRECWEDGEKDCKCVGCLQSGILPNHPLYIRDEDNDFDCTYCTTWFRVPDEAKEKMAAIAVERPDITGNWMALFSALESAITR